jgi:penicillin-insensitive murein endopeptidase
MRIWGVLFIFSAMVANAQDLPQNDWSRVAVPSSGAPHSIGFYSNGCIAGAQALPEGTGYQIMRPFRNRFYGQPETVQFVQQLGLIMNAASSGILVGDMGQPRGGPLPYGHASHQVGLDVDIWFWTHPEQTVRELTVNERNTLPFVDMLNSNGVVDPHQFTNDQILKLKTATLNPLVERIFVNPAIKVYLCSTLDEKDLEWLHKLRPWPGHNEHFHVRLKCPANSPTCIPQAAVDAGSGCSEVLPPRKVTTIDPSHSEEHETNDPILDQILNSGTAETIPPVIPAACQAVLKQKPLN